MNRPLFRMVIASVSIGDETLDRYTAKANSFITRHDVERTARWTLVFVHRFDTARAGYSLYFID